ncbi:MAG: hypothetical protein E4H37_04870 [Gemmatimonadales bacterium]|nr:MAG: hypothetical protein E4H37_04870 [Gemmatimonadales bacterium]
MTQVTWLRTSYWAGAIADVLVGVLALVPSRMGLPAFRYPMGLAASVMFAWTILLLWADRKPLERRGVLPITVFVIIGLMLSGVYSVITGLFAVSRIMPTSVLGAVLIVLMLFSYFSAAGADQN